LDPDYIARARAELMGASGYERYGQTSAWRDMSIWIPNFTVERWVNSAPLTADALSGKVVLIDFWEYTCINWIRTLPYIKAWNRAYADLGLVVIGVHAPEFEFGRHAENIDCGIRDHDLTYPIALDNDFAVWHALGNNAWPAKYLFDVQGLLADRWVGEGGYDRAPSPCPVLGGAVTSTSNSRLAAARSCFPSPLGR
jgi:hypothetical protein